MIDTINNLPLPAAGEGEEERGNGLYVGSDPGGGDCFGADNCLAMTNTFIIQTSHYLPGFRIALIPRHRVAASDGSPLSRLQKDPL